MPKTDQVPVFYRDQNEVCERPAFLWSRSECRERKNVAGKFFDHGKSFRLFSPRPKIYPVTAAELKASNIIPDATTITLSETLANVGIAGKPEDVAAPKHIVKRAQDKINAYRKTYDDLATLALIARPRPSNLRVFVVQ